MSFWKNLFGGKHKPSSSNQKESGNVPVHSTVKKENTVQKEKDYTVSKDVTPFSMNNRSDSMPLQRQRREVRVFVSSTFRDMFEDREELIKKVFPQIRKICAERFVTFTEVDLRWGITDEQVAEGKVLPLCLEEIRLSHPYFIGLLGERYGWIPKSMDEGLENKEPWLKEHRERSVTELEILHGVLIEPNMNDHAFFYFRDPSYIGTIDVAKQPDYKSEGPAEEEKLKSLKGRICDAHKEGKLRYAPRENYKNPEALGALVTKDLMELIDTLFPALDVPDADSREADAHEMYAGSKRMCYVELPGTMQAFDNIVNEGGGFLVVTGESGSGKTAFLSKWAECRQNYHPDDFLFQHYFGATPESAQALSTVRRLLSELKKRYEITEEIPSTPDKLREALPLWLAKTNGKKRIVIVLDALNQIEGEEQDRRLEWLPRQEPEHVCVICSALPGPALEELNKRGWPVFKLPVPEIKERKEMIDVFFSHYRKTLAEDLKERLAASAQAASPLYLRTVLEELRQFGRHEELKECLDNYLKASDPKDLFRRVITRWRKDFDGGRGLVGRALTRLWAARQGLEEKELLELLKDGKEPLIRADWSPIFLGMEAHLTNKGGLHAFGHEYLKKAVEDEFLDSPDPKRKEQLQHKAHLELADYFEAQDGMSARKAAEWPWQVRHAEDWERLKKCLINKALFLELFNARTKWELTGYWLSLETQGVHMEEAYMVVWEEWESKAPDEKGRAFLANQLALFLVDNGRYDFSEPLYRRALEGRERALGKDHPDTLQSVNNLAVLLNSKGDFMAAEPLLKRALEGRERALGKDHPDTLTSVGKLANLFYNTENFLAAEMLFRRALEGKERVLGKDHPETLMSVYDLAFSLDSKGDYAAAEPLYERAIEGSERALGKDHPDTLLSVNNLAVLLHRSKGDFAAAEPLYRKALEGRERVLGKDHPETLQSVNGLSILLINKGDYAAAEPLLRRALEGYEYVHGKNDSRTLGCVNNLANLFYSKGDYAAAEPLYRRTLLGFYRISKSRGWEDSWFKDSLNNYKRLLIKTGLTEEQAMKKIQDLLAN
jgi:nephrocystin-3